jgi:hypothetical protein
MYIKNRDYSIKAVYKLMCYEAYGVQFLNTNIPGTPLEDYKPIQGIPTEKQFYYYVATRSTEEEKKIAKVGRREARNSNRMTLSDTVKDALGPGYICEVDAWESDVECVSRYDSSQNIGRAIVYLLIDVFSKCIVAFSIGIDNNSDDGIMNLFINMADDKQQLFERYGFTPIPGIMPTPFIPLKIRHDRGAEYLSKAFRQRCNSLGIITEAVPPGSGSFKPNIEQSFHRLDKSSFAVLGNDYGRINKNYDSKHKETACMDLDDITKIVINFVLTNNSRYMKDYPRTQNMILNSVEPIPSQLWKYGTQSYGLKRIIPNIKQFMYEVFKPIEKNITKNGIEFNKRFYINDDVYIPEISYKNNHRSIKMNARYDPRCVNHIYYVHPDEPEIYVASLNPNKTGNMDFWNMSEYEVTLFNKRKAEMDGIGKLYNRDSELLTAALTMDIAKESKNYQKQKPSDKNKRIHRAVEKAMDNRIRGASNIEDLNYFEALDGFPIIENELYVPLPEPQEPDFLSEIENDKSLKEEKADLLRKKPADRITGKHSVEEKLDMYQYFCKGGIEDV